MGPRSMKYMLIAIFCMASFYSTILPVSAGDSSPEEVAAAYEDVRNDATDTNW